MGGSSGSFVAAYVRVSSEGQSLESQESEIRKWLEGQSVGSVRWYRDVVSGSSVSRPELSRLRRDIGAGRVHTVVVYKLDRLSRSLRDGVSLIGDWCDAGVRLVSVTQQIDLSGVLGRTMAALLLGLAEMEREHIRERQRAGIEAAKACGKQMGRRPGYRKKSPERVRQLRERGLTQQEIAESLGIGRRTVIRYLQEVGDS